MQRQQHALIKRLYSKTIKGSCTDNKVLTENSFFKNSLVVYYYSFQIFLQKKVIYLKFLRNNLSVTKLLCL